MSVYAFRELKLRGKSTTQGFRSAIYYVDMTIREGLSLEKAIQQAQPTQPTTLADKLEQRATA